MKTKTLRGKRKQQRRIKTRRRKRSIPVDSLTLKYLIDVNRNGKKRTLSSELITKCSPKPLHELNNFTCYTDTSLLKLKHKWNAKNPHNKITATSTKDIHAQLKEHFKDVCTNEACWLKQHAVFSDISEELSESFAPKSPNTWKTNPNEWLSSTDIIKVMKQYEKAYKHFKFIGPSPIDFDKKLSSGKCVWSELCNLNIQHYIKRGIYKIGIILNTDTHDKSGQHWISMFVNIHKKNIFFFDSTGDKEPPQITALIRRLVHQGTQCNPPIIFKVDNNNGTAHQNGNTECGIYSLYFIVHMLQDKTSEQYLKTRLLKDSYIQQFRKIYFNI